MKKLSKSRVSTIIILLLLIVFGILYIIFDTNLFNNDKRVSFNEAVSRQQNKGVLNMKEDHGEFKKQMKMILKRPCQFIMAITNSNIWIFPKKYLCQKKKLIKCLKEKGF